MSTFGPWRASKEAKPEKPVFKRTVSGVLSPRTRPSSSKQRALQKKGVQHSWMSTAAGLVKYLPGLVIGFALGLMVQFSSRDGDPGTKNPWERQGSRARNKSIRLRNASQSSVGTNTSETATSTDSSELKMVFVVRQDLKMGGGKVASQCAPSDPSPGEFSSDFRSDFDAAVGIYTQLLSRQRPLLSKWEQCGQPKIVVTCKNQLEMTDLKHKAEKAGLPTYTVADAGRTQVAAGSKTVLAIGPGPKDIVDSITRHLRLL